MEETDTVGDIRLIVLETIVQKMLASRMAELPPEESLRLKRSFIESMSRFDVLLPGEIVEMKALEPKQRALAVHVRAFFASVEVREQDVRRQTGRPLAYPL